MGDHRDGAREATLADSVTADLLAAMALLAPAERTAFVLHEVLAVPLDEVGRILDHSPAMTRQIARRARRQVRAARPPS
jgi:RNA polymerase sigma-70 factor, ECF subfamily